MFMQMRFWTYFCAYEHCTKTA